MIIRLRPIAAAATLSFFASAATAALETHIDMVGYDLDSRTLVIDGVQFSPNAPLRAPYVEVGGLPATILTWSKTEVTVRIPDAVNEGEFQIYVERRDTATQRPHIGAQAGARAYYALTLKDFD